MPERKFGFASAHVGAVNLTTGLGENFTDIGEVIRATINMSEGEATIERFYSELKNDPIVSIETGQKEETYNLTLADTSADNLAMFCGGTVTGVAPAPKRWNQPEGVVDIEMAFEFTLKSGAKMLINRAKVYGRREWTGRNGMASLIVKIEPIDTGVPNVASVVWIDATPQVI